MPELFLLPGNVIKEPSYIYESSGSGKLSVIIGGAHETRDATAETLTPTIPVEDDKFVFGSDDCHSLFNGFVRL